jgi:hypothetical protein
MLLIFRLLFVTPSNFIIFFAEVEFLVRSYVGTRGYTFGQNMITGIKKKRIFKKCLWKIIICQTIFFSPETQYFHNYFFFNILIRMYFWLFVKKNNSCLFRRKNIQYLWTPNVNNFCQCKINGFFVFILCLSQVGRNTKKIRSWKV